MKEVLALFIFWAPTYNNCRVLAGSFFVFYLSPLDTI